MLKAIPKHAFSGDFHIFREDGSEIAFLDIATFKEAADLIIEDVNYRFEREKMMKGAFLLKMGDEVFIKAEKPSAFRNQFELTIHGDAYLLKRVSVWKREYVLEKDGEIIGNIRPTGALSRKSEIDLPEDWPVVVQIFIFWLVLIIWNREAAAS